MDSKTAVPPRCPFCDVPLEEAALVPSLGLESRRCGCGRYVLLLWSAGLSRVLEALPAPRWARAAAVR